MVKFASSIFQAPLDRFLVDGLACGCLNWPESCKDIPALVSFSSMTIHLDEAWPAKQRLQAKSADASSSRIYTRIFLFFVRPQCCGLAT
jgi:hypothetical protein